MPNPRAQKPLTLDQVKNELGGAAFGIYPQAGKRGQRQRPAPQPEKVIVDDRAMEYPFGELDLSVPTKENRDLSQRMVEREVERKRQADQDTSPLEKLAGGIQTGRLIGSALTQLVNSVPTRVVYGNEAGDKFMEERMYRPNQPKAYEYAGDIADFLTSLETDYKIPPIIPQLMGMEAVAGPAARQAGKAAKPVVGKALEDYMLNQGLALPVVKPKGGNFRGNLGIVRDQLIRGQDAAIQNWVDSNLTNYVKKQMASPDDPVRKLADEGISHLPESYLTDRQYAPTHVRRERSEAGFPEEGLATTPMGKGWESIADQSIFGRKVKEQTNLSRSRNPWMDKLDPEEKIFEFGLEDRGGFGHIIDVLREDLTTGRIRPEQLNKVSMEQAVRRTAEYDQEMAKRMAESKIRATEGMPVYKDYGDKGYQWIELAPSKEPKTYTADSLPSGFELKRDRDGYYQVLNRNVGEAPTTDSFSRDPAQAISKFNDWVKNSKRDFDLERGLKYEGETMGHCVGGYCPDVLEGRSRIFSLRDAKGEPHVTVEVEPGHPLEGHKNLNSAEKLELHNQVVAEHYGGQEPDLKNVFFDLANYEKHPYFQKISEAYVNKYGMPASSIQQIKGKQNAAPKKEYLPFVQDFVRSGEWSDVGDLGNTGLVKIDPKSDLALSLKNAGQEYSPYVTQDELTELLNRGRNQGNIPTPEEGMAHGGRVHISDNPDTMAMELAGGGLVKKAAKAATKAVKGTQDVLPAADREENLQRFLGNSRIRDRLYHATPKNFSEFKPGGYDPNLSGPAIWLTPNAESQPAAHNIGGGNRGFKEGVNVMPVYVQARSPLLLDDELSIEWARDVYANGSPEFPDLIHPNTIEELKKGGYDSIIHADPYGNRGGEQEIIMFEPNKIKSAIGNRGTYDIEDPDITKAAGGAVRMQAGGAFKAAAKAAKAAPKAAPKPIVQAPSVIIPSKLSNVKEAIRQSKGDFGARRVERAADEIPNLEKLYKEQALREAFGGDNAKALITMNPKSFERYAAPIDARFTDKNSTRHTPSGEVVSYEEYMEDYLPNVGAFNDVPFLQINKEEQGLPLLPFISGHEGRHRNRVLANKGEKSGLVILSPRSELREPFPRRSQDEYLQALRDELDITGNLVLPEKYQVPSDSLYNQDFQRPAIVLPDIYAEGGEVQISNNPDSMQMELDNKKFDMGGAVVNPSDVGAPSPQNSASPIPSFQAGGGLSVLKKVITSGNAEAAKAARVAALRQSGLSVAEANARVELAEQAAQMKQAIKASEALAKIEGKHLNITQADRTKVGGGYLGGPGFSGLQMKEGPYKDVGAVWGVKNTGTAKTMLGGFENPLGNEYFTTMIGSPTQHQSNQMVFDKLYKDFTAQAKKGKLDPELRQKINDRLASAVDKDGKPIFPSDIDILSKNFKKQATTFDQRAVAGNVLGGVGIGGKKGQIFDYEKVIRDTTDPFLLDTPSGDLGYRIWTPSGEVIERPDLHPAFPAIATGEDLGVEFKPADKNILLAPFLEKFRAEKGREPGYMDMTRGRPVRVQITEPLLKSLDVSGNKKGGAIRMNEGGSLPDVEYDSKKPFEITKQGMKQFINGNDISMGNLGVNVPLDNQSIDFGLNSTRVARDNTDMQLHALAARYGLNINDSNFMANLSKMIEGEGYNLDLIGSTPVGRGRLSAGLHGSHHYGKNSKDATSLGYSTKLGDGNFQANVALPTRGGKPMVSIQYSVPFADGGAVSALMKHAEIAGQSARMNNQRM